MLTPPLTIPKPTSPDTLWANPPTPCSEVNACYQMSRMSYYYRCLPSLPNMDWHTSAPAAARWDRKCRCPPTLWKPTCYRRAPSNWGRGMPPSSPGRFLRLTITAGRCRHRPWCTRRGRMWPCPPPPNEDVGPAGHVREKTMKSKPESSARGLHPCQSQWALPGRRHPHQNWWEPMSRGHNGTWFRRWCPGGDTPPWESDANVEVEVERRHRGALNDACGACSGVPTPNNPSLMLMSSDATEEPPTTPMEPAPEQRPLTTPESLMLMSRSKSSDAT